MCGVSSLQSCSKDDDGNGDGGNLDYLIGTWKSDIPHKGGDYHRFIQEADGSGKAEGYYEWTSGGSSGTDYLSYKWQKLEMKEGKLVGSNEMTSLEWKAVLKSHTSTKLVFDDFFGWGYVELTKVD